MSILQVVHRFSCLDEGNYYILRVSDPVYSTSCYILSSPNVSSQLKARYTRQFSLYFESELFRRRDPSTIGEEFDFYKCELIDSLMKQPSASFNSFSDLHFRPLFILLHHASILTLIVYIFELIFGIKRLPSPVERTKS